MPSAVDSSLAPRTQAVRRLAHDLGFALVGIAPALPSDHGDELRRWLAAGAHGDMAYMNRDIDQRLDPRKLVPGARVVICVVDRYESGGADQSEIPTGRIARYARGQDYHRVIKKRLHRLADDLRVRWPEHQFRSAVDTAPVMEREHATRAGLGWIGKHTLMLHPRLGSWLLLGEIITTLPMQTDVEAGLAPATPVDHCGTCTRCIDACPTRCITEYHVEASRCISYLTLEHRGPIAPEFHPPMADWIAGCDVCQEVCPFNAGGSAAPDPVRAEYKPRDGVTALPLLEVLHWDEAKRRTAFERSALKRVKLDMIKRNALIAAGNHLRRCDDAELRARIAQIADDTREPTMLRDTARAVLAHRG